MTSMMDLMFPATAAPVVEKESRKDGTFGGALEPSHADGQGARGDTLRPYNKDRAIQLPAEIKLKIRVYLRGERAQNADESRNRFDREGIGGATQTAAARGEPTDIELTFNDPLTTIYGLKLQIMETQKLFGMLTVMKWQTILRVNGKTVSDICSLADYPNEVMEGEWEAEVMEKHELLVLDNGCT
jgi:hypothetical protein|eukprot:COSAG02_NODE_46_length_45443_cov_36.731497_15_plen_186_part_00